MPGQAPLEEVRELLEKVGRLNPSGLEEVRGFLIDVLKRTISEKHIFHFEGSDRTGYCGVAEPHPPHIIGHYNTVRAGLLEYFCLGKEGIVEVNGKMYRLNIVVERYKPGSPYSSTKADGFYYFEEVKGA